MILYKISGTDPQPSCHLCPKSSFKIPHLLRLNITRLPKTGVDFIYIYISFVCWMIFFVGSSLFPAQTRQAKGSHAEDSPDVRGLCRLRFHIGDAGTPRSDWHRGKSLRWKFHVENGGGTKGVPSQGLAD